MTNEIKHTPGPWFWTGEPFRSQLKFGDGETDAIIDYYEWENMWGSVWRSKEETDANARLIAAAPDLLEALKMAQLWLDVDGRFDMRGINAAIAKAEGRT